MTNSLYLTKRHLIPSSVTHRATACTTRRVSLRILAPRELVDCPGPIELYKTTIIGPSGPGWAWRGIPLDRGSGRFAQGSVSFTIVMTSSLRTAPPVQTRRSFAVSTHRTVTDD